MDELNFIDVAFFLGMLTMSVIFYRGWKVNKYTDSKDWFYASVIGLTVIIVFHIRDIFFDLSFPLSVSISVVGIVLMLGSMFYAWWKNR